MKITKSKITGMMTFWLIFNCVACGGLKVGADQETLDAAKCLANPDRCDDDSGSSTDEVSSDSETNDSSTEESGYSSSSDFSDDSYENGSVDPADSTGGVDYLPISSKGGSDRYFMGTYSLSSSGYPLSCTSSYGNGYDFPATVRLYSYDDNVDFEDSYGNLVWIAQVYPDDTFDFKVQLLDQFGKPSNAIACTCDITVPYYNDKERVSCTCDPSYAGDETCSITYDGL